MAKNPNIKVNITQKGWDDYWSGIQNGMVAGTAPDVFTDHLAKYPEFAAKDQLVDIQPYVDRDKVDMSVYLSGLADLWGSRRQALRPAQGLGHDRHRVQQGHAR